MELIAIKEFLLYLQNKICKSIEDQDTEKKFMIDHWSRVEGSFGETRIISDGKVIERGGVNFSYITGDNLPPAATLKRPDLAGRKFVALGISVVIHPTNPYVPTSHANLRFFCAERKGSAPIWWFGGGFDLTPYYPFEEDCIHWHTMAANACKPYGANFYSKYKKWCDEYFYINHRQEMRGIGGLFFDDLNEDGFKNCFAFLKSVGEHYLLGYLPILEQRKKTPYTDRERNFQLYRRGRYVEFNLIQDRGTLFGLQSGGRVESILMSLPPLATWRYDWKPSKDTPESDLTEHFLQAREWI